VQALWTSGTRSRKHRDVQNHFLKAALPVDVCDIASGFVTITRSSSRAVRFPQLHKKY
jgi:hypothetical protein